MLKLGILGAVVTGTALILVVLRGVAHVGLDVGYSPAQPIARR